MEGLRLALEKDLPVHFVDRDTEGYPVDRTPMPDPYALRKIGHYAFCQAFARSGLDATRYLEDDLREKTMAYHLQQLSQSGERILFVCGMLHFPGVLSMLDEPQTEVIGRRHREGVGLAHLHRESSREILSEMPYLVARYEESRRKGEEVDRMEVNGELISAARENHLKNSKEELSPTQLGVLHRFARNYALLSGGLVPSFYQLIVAARGAAEDNFA